MVKAVLKDIKCLQKCEEATSADRILITNLIETFRYYKENHNYLSANMIGENKRMFIYEFYHYESLIINPVITGLEEPYETTQECIYHKARRTVTRYKKVHFECINSNFDIIRDGHLEGQPALTFQHMMDHINGVLI